MTTPKRRPGRPSKLNPRITEQFISLLEQGSDINASAAACGISHTALYNWLAKGEANTAKEYREFWEAVQRAKASAEAHLVERIRDYADSEKQNSWRAAAWMLEHINPEKWGERSSLRVEQTVRTEGVKNPEHDSPERIAAVLDILARAGAIPVAGAARSPPENYTT